MGKEQNKKSGSVNGKKLKKGSPGRRSFFFKPATIILALLTTLLIVLGILYLARIQHWFSSPATQERNVTKKVPLPEEYHNISDKLQRDNEPLPRAEKPMIAIIIDDLGADLGMMQNFLDLRLNLTAAVLPNVPNARAVAELAHADGREIILHMPMEPKDYPVANPGEHALMVDLTTAEIQNLLRGYLHTVPWVVGANNHMGSRFTESREGMREVLTILKEQGLFFVDSRTTADTVAISEARQMKIAYAERDLFLDNDLNEEAIRGQIRKLIEIALDKGSAIGICHPHYETYTALKKEAAGFSAAGVKLVSVSALLN